MKLAAALHTLGSETESFCLLLHWLGGDVPRTALELTTPKLLALVESNALGNNVLYRVG